MKAPLKFALIVALATGAAGAQTAEATLPGYNGRLAFVHSTGELDGCGDGYLGTSGIWSVRSDGLERRPMTARGTDASAPAFSPGGTRLAFVRDNSQLVVGGGRRTAPSHLQVRPGPEPGLVAE